MFDPQPHTERHLNLFSRRALLILTGVLLLLAAAGLGLRNWMDQRQAGLLSKEILARAEAALLENSPSASHLPEGTADGSSNLSVPDNGVQTASWEGYDIIVSIPDNLPEELRDERIAFVRNSISRFGTNPLSELKTVLALRKQIRQVNPNTVVTFTIKPNLYSLIACGRRYPVIANVTGLSAFLFKSGLVPSVISKIQNMMFKRAFCLFCQNRETYERFEHLGLKNIRLLPGSGVNVETIRYTEYPLYSGKNCPNITYLGRLSHNETLKNVAASHVLILPSYHEGMANVILEAHALGRPVLTTNVAGCIDAIEDGKTGISFVRKSSDAVVDACNKFALLPWNEWKHMGIEGRRFVEENFDRRIVVDEYMKAIREAIGK